MRVERLDHVHIFVKDVEKAARFFSEVFGTEFSPFVETTEAEEAEKTGSGVDAPGRDLKAVIDPLGLELIQPLSPESPVAKHIERKGEGLAGISFKVRNVDEWVKHAEAHGMRVIGRVNLQGLREVQLHPKDAFGVYIELSEYEEKHGNWHAVQQAKRPEQRGSS